MLQNKKVTALASSAPTDERQPLDDDYNVSIPDQTAKIKAEDENSVYQPKNNVDRLHTVSLTELYDTVYPPKTQVVENLLYAGVYLFAGAPKVGKSFFMAQLGYHVSKGIPLWEYPTHKGTVLYLALEDDYARLQKRMFRMFGANEGETLHFATRAKNLSEGLDEQIINFIQEVGITKLVIIDTLQKIREMGGDKYSYASDYEIITKLKHLAEHLSICILVVHHTRKQNADDCFETISGTNGLMGAADGAFIMAKEKRTDNKAIIDIVGRDQQDQRLYLEFDRDKCLWLLTKAENECITDPPDEVVESVAKFLSPDLGEWSGSATELVKELGIDISPNVLGRRLNVCADKLWDNHSIRIESGRCHAGRSIKLEFVSEKA